MKLENCGRCGLEPFKMAQIQQYIHGQSEQTMVDTWGCPVHDANEWTGKTEGQWNAAQFAARTERINAAAVAIAQAWCSPRNFGQFSGIGGYIESSCAEVNGEVVVVNAVALIDAQDAAARVRWAEMQKGE